MTKLFSSLFSNLIMLVRFGISKDVQSIRYINAGAANITAYITILLEAITISENRELRIVVALYNAWSLRKIGTSSSVYPKSTLHSPMTQDALNETSAILNAPTEINNKPTNCNGETFFSQHLI